MDDILFSSAIANELNHLVCTQIAGHLFLFCNYEPAIPSALAMDGKYFLGVQNLYRLYIDCSCILPKQNMMKLWLDAASYQKYLAVKHKIQMLRSCIDHNNSSQNGCREQKRLEEYAQWLYCTIQKSTPSDQRDYQLLVDALRHLSQQMCDLAKEAIEKIHSASASQKAAWIQQWEDETIRWYSQKNTKRDIFLGELENIYIAYTGIPGNSKTLSRQIANWCMQFCNCYKGQLTKAMTSLEQKGAHQSPIYVKLGQQINKIQRYDEQYNSKHSIYVYQDCICNLLENLLPDTLHQEQCTMLPQDLLQTQIKIMFDDCDPTK